MHLYLMRKRVWVGRAATEKLKTSVQWTKSDQTKSGWDGNLFEIITANAGAGADAGFHDDRRRVRAGQGWKV